MKRFNVELDMGGFVARVEGQCSAGYPAKTNCPVEEGYEGRGDTIEVESVEIASKGSYGRFGYGLCELFYDDIKAFAERYASQIKDALIDGGYL